MKRLLLLLTFAILSLAVYGQFSCSPNLIFKDSSAGVYPSPYDPVLTPGGGIRTCAIKGQYYQFDFTVVVGDSLSFSGFRFPLDSVVVNKVTGLPAGMQYGCSPANCVFKKKTTGCASVYGTTTAAVTPGKYALKIQGTAYLNGSPLGLPIEFPGPIAPGTYELEVLADSQTPCSVSNSLERLLDQVALHVHPNPASGKVSVDVTSSVSGNFNLKLSDLLGRVVYNSKVSVVQGTNRYEVETSSLTNGLFVISLENEFGKINSRLAVQR